MANRRTIKIGELAAVMEPAVDAYLVLDMCRERGILKQDRHPNPSARERIIRVLEECEKGMITK